jgi:hypothetical protein
MKSYQIKSAAIIAVIVVFMVAIGYFINDFNQKITGAAVAPVCRCSEDINCYDNDPCTEDICLYKESCSAALCINREIKDCK